MNPCVVNNFVVIMPSFTYVIGSGKFKSESFNVIPDPATCSYESTADYAGLPNFVAIDSNNLIVETSDRLEASSNQVNLNVKMKIPTD